MTNFTWYDVSDATVGLLFGLAGVRTMHCVDWSAVGADALKRAQLRLAGGSRSGITRRS